MLDDDFVFFGTKSELATFPNIVGNGFLDVNMLAVGSCGERDENVGVVWRGDAYGINVLGLAELAVVGIGIDLDPLLFQALFAFCEDSRITIAERDDSATFHAQQVIDVTVTTAIETDHGNTHDIIGSEGTSKWRKERPCASEGRCLENLTTVHVGWWDGWRV